MTHPNATTPRSPQAQLLQPQSVFLSLSKLQLGSLQGLTYFGQVIPKHAAPAIHPSTPFSRYHRTVSALGSLDPALLLRGSYREHSSFPGFCEGARKSKEKGNQDKPPHLSSSPTGNERPGQLPLLGVYCKRSLVSSVQHRTSIILPLHPCTPPVPPGSDQRSAHPRLSLRHSDSISVPCRIRLDLGTGQGRTCVEAIDALERTADQ